MVGALVGALAPEELEPIRAIVLLADPTADPEAPYAFPVETNGEPSAAWQYGGALYEDALPPSLHDRTLSICMTGDPACGITLIDDPMNIYKVPFASGEIHSRGYDVERVPNLVASTARFMFNRMFDVGHAQPGVPFEEGIGPADPGVGGVVGGLFGGAPSSSGGSQRDEIIGQREDGTLRAYPNERGFDGFPFSDPVVVGTGWNDPARVFFADIDGDGRDEVVGLWSDATLRAYPNHNGFEGFPFGAPVLIGTGWSHPERVWFADIDGDGRDEVIGWGEDATLRAFPNVRGLSGFPFADPVVIGTGWYDPKRVAFADIDGDRRAEVIMVRDDGTLQAYPNQRGFQGFPFGAPVMVGSGWYDPARTFFADIDGDGRDEVLMVRDDGTVSAFPNVRGFHGFPFGDPVTVGSGWYDPQRVHFADID